VAAFGRRLDEAHFSYKAELVATWCLAERGREASASERALLREAFGVVAAAARAAPQRLAHRDFQSANLMLRDAAPRLGMIDLQGALLAPPEYDLVCLLRDSYVALPEEEVQEHLERTRATLPDAPDRESCARRFDLLAIARKGKDAARFLYAARARGDARFLRWVGPTLRQVRAAAERAAERDPQIAALGALADLLTSLPETACAR
jgi:aminoglycoside/choline kinase family phosphotransferase